VVDLVRGPAAELFPGIPLGMDPWVVEGQAAAVVAHARHGRLDLVEEITSELSQRLTTMLEHPVPNPPSYLMELPLCGSLLLALGMVDLASGKPGPGVRLIALAERFGFLRNFQPTMSAIRAREDAEHADGPAYADAMSEYAGLDRDQLRAAALTCLRGRG
jgi:hypothetical protein